MSEVDFSRKRCKSAMAAMALEGWVPSNIIAAVLRCCFIGENGLTKEASIFTGGIVKIPIRRDVACKVSGAQRGGNWCFCSSSSNQRWYQLSLLGKVRSSSLSSFPLQILIPEIVEQCWDLTFSLFKCVSKIGCQIFTNNKHSQKTD